MIKSSIRLNHNHQYATIATFSEDLFIADYTEQTRNDAIKRNVEFSSPVCPNDINCFSVKNNLKVTIDGIAFNNLSFVCGTNTRSQCEAVVFPSVSTQNSWILFCELKYSSKPANNVNNLRKAIKQLYRTRYYYFQTNTISQTNRCYLIASLPMQQEPFANFTITPAESTKLKRTRNIILRLQNAIEIENEEHLIV